MSSPFPGMNPYLENPAFWSEVHHRLIVNLADTLAPQIPPQYRVAIEQRTYSINVLAFMSPPQQAVRTLTC